MVLLRGTISRTMGWQWYNAANNAYWGGFYGYTHAPPVSLFPYPVMFAGWLVNNAVFQFVLILFAGLSFLGWSSSLFIASTRQIFAAAFDRVLPAWAARVTDRRGVPVGALALIAVPSVVFSALYAYSTTFRTYLFDATVVLAVTFVGTSLAAALLPWRARALYEASAVSRFRIAGIPGVTIAAVLYGGVMVFSIVLWLRDSVYGVNAHESLVYMGALYVVAIVIYVVAKVIRSREGVDLSKAYDEIPAD
jgi:amino acid transporter